MSETTHFHSDLIRTLGGKAKLAEALSLDRSALTKWHERGIPAKYWHEIIKFGAALPEPVLVTPEELARTKPVASGEAV